MSEGGFSLRAANGREGGFNETEEDSTEHVPDPQEASLLILFPHQEVHLKKGSTDKNEHASIHPLV